MPPVDLEGSEPPSVLSMPAREMPEALAAATSSHAPLAVALASDGVAFASARRVWWAPTAHPAEAITAVATVEALVHPRWVWWRASDDATALVAAGVHLGACWDLAAVHRLLHGGTDDDPATVWATAHGLPETGIPRSGQLTFGDDPPGCIGYLSVETMRDAPGRARLALQAFDAQQSLVTRLAGSQRPMMRLTVRSESVAALVALELAHDGLPFDVETAEQIIRSLVGPRASDPMAQAAARSSRDDSVRRLVPGAEDVDLRSPAQVRDLLARVGIAVPDTRARRLEGYRDAHPVVEALIAWRKSERIATTYGYGWLDTHVHGGRLRGGWTASDGGAGRMTAQAGLHNLPNELRTAVRAEPGHRLVRADLGQVEPRVLAAVSGDTALAAACEEDDLYAPVAARLGCDRATAKVAVLAAMYGQTSGAAGAALRGMDHAYPVAMRYLRDAEAAGRAGRAVRTYGGRLVRMWGGESDASPPVVAARGRFARNAVVQGAAAELFKAWTATVRARLHELHGSGTPDGPSARIVLCLHDELVVQAAERVAEAVGDILVESLAATSRWWCPPAHRVRLVADVAVVQRWSQAKP